VDLLTTSNISINIRLLRHDKMQANNSKQKGNTVSKKKIKKQVSVRLKVAMYMPQAL